MNCAKCGKCITDKYGTKMSGIHIEVAFDYPVDYEQIDFAKKQFGKYDAPEYDFCFECLIDSFMGK